MWSKQANLAATIVTQLRLPRAVLALEVGGALGLAGAVLQGVTRNPLAEPGLLGVSAGAALGAVIAVYFGFAAHFASLAPLLGLIGALLASSLTFALGRGGGTITLVFGLIHGFGFAADLLELQLPTQRLAELLVGFNLGVEVGQLALVVGTTLLVLGLKRMRLALPRPIVVDVASAFLMALGVFWFVSRSYA